MPLTDLSAGAPILRREECKRTRHDSVFSQWKILVGPSDWEDYSLGKEGCERYRVHNLPEKLGPGVYELGIYVPPTGLGLRTNKLDPDRIAVVYLGQADNVRARLQRYGRTGAHLGSANHPKDTRDVSSKKGPGLFEQIFSLGYHIVYRWAPMRNKKYALETESELLGTFDYAWNTNSNGLRRPDDILQKLNKIASGKPKLSYMSKMLLPFTKKQSGIRIKSSKLCSPEKKIYDDDCENRRYNFLPAVFQFNRSRPQLALDQTGVTEETANVCGITLSDGSVCRRLPVRGRKRCSQHKGMRINKFNPNSNRKGKLEDLVHLESNVNGEKGVDGRNVPYFIHEEEKLPGIALDPPVSNSSNTICGFILKDGYPCRKQPVSGRKRCGEHKGRRIATPINKPQATGNPYYVQEVVSDSNDGDGLEDYEQKIRARSKPGQVQCRTSSYNPVTGKPYDSIRGVDLGHGSFCMKQPVKGRVRCEEHKGMRVGTLVRF